MHKAPLALAVLGTAVSALAQVSCNGTPTASTMWTVNPFGATHYMGTATGSNDSSNLYFDATVAGNLSISAMAITTYDYTGTPNPNQAGATTTVNLYSIPGTWTGNTASSTGWTLLGSGTLTVSGTFLAPNPIVFSTAALVGPGTYGFALQIMPTVAPNSPNPGPLHPLLTIPAGTSTVSDPFWSISPNQGFQSQSWTAATPTGAGTAVNNINITYTPAATSAAWIAAGQGCYNRPRAFYEAYAAPNATPDLENTVLSLLPSAGPSGPNFLVIPGGGAYVTPTGTPRNSVPSAVVPPGYTAGTWDDALDTPFPLPFTFNFPGGSTNIITAGSNGLVFLGSVSAGNHAYGFYSAYNSFQNNAPCIAAFWGDLDPVNGSGTGSGDIYIETDNATWVRISWHQIEEWTPGGVGPLSSLQITLYASGQVDIAYGDLNIQGAEALVGFSAGGGQAIGSAIDISASLPFTSGDGAYPPVLGMSATPVLGTTPNVVTTNCYPTSAFQFTVAALGSQAPLDLGIYGMPGCDLHLSFGAIVAAFLSPVTAGTATVPFAIPTGASWIGVQFFFQTAPLTPGLNPAGILVSNVICVRLGL